MRLPGGFYSEDETCEQSYMIHVTFRMHDIAEIRSSTAADRPVGSTGYIHALWVYTCPLSTYMSSVHVHVP